NLLAARHLATPRAPAPAADVPQPSGGSDRNAIPLYDFPNVKVVKHYIADAPIRTSALRTLGGYANVFALESFVDELAALAGADPVEFRLRHLLDKRARAVIEAAAPRAGWPPRAPGDCERRGRPCARPRLRLRQVQEPRLLLRDGRRRRGRGEDRRGARRARRGRRRRGADRQPRRRDQPDRGRDHPVGELDLERVRPL